MKRKCLCVIAVILASTSSLARAEVASPDYVMSPALLELFRSEMRSLLSGSQTIAAALPNADWAAIATTSKRMKQSYVLELQLNEEQRLELERRPEQFKRLDAQFHRGTEKLALAAEQKDAQLVAFYFGRLLEECTQCHATYAQSRFPGFSHEATNADHRH